MLDLKIALGALWPFIKPEKKRLWLIFASGLAMAVLTPLSTKLIDMLLKAFEARDAAVGSWIPFAFPALFIVLGPMRYYHTRITKFTSEIIVARIQRRLHEQFVHLNLTFHNTYAAGSGGLLSRVLNDTQILQEGLFYCVDLIREPITAIGLIAWMLYFNWRMTLFTFAVAPFFVILMRQVRKSLRKYGYRSREALEELTGTLKETLDGVRIIQSFNLEDKMRGRFADNIDAYLDTRFKIITREEAISPINEFVGATAFMGISLVAFHEILGGRTQPAEFIAFVVAAGILQPPIKKIQNAMVKIQQTIVVVERLMGLLNSTERVPQIAAPHPFPHAWSQIQFDDVSFSYGGEHVLSHVNLTVKRGEVIALVGESGSGKSTLVNLLERFFDATSGTIKIDGVSITDFDLKDLRKHVALVTQDVFLFRESIEENIRAGDLDRLDKNTEPASHLANAHGFITRNPQGYQTNVGERGGRLSGGEKQRVSIARAIYKDAPILILDEATSALDSVSEMEVQKGLQQLMKGRTVFVIAHRLSTIFNADRILVMRKGQIVEQGTHDELLERKGEYFNFFSLQTNVGR